MDRPLVSIVIPVYNEAEHLPAMLSSVLNQSWPDLQAIMVDDGSTDGSPDIARRFAETDPRLTLLVQKNAGVSAARNTALAHCRGKYIRFVDGDDTLPPHSLEAMVARAEKDKADLVIGGYTQFLGKTCQHFNRANRSDTISCHELLKTLNWQANSLFYGVLWNKLFRRELITRPPAVRFTSGLTYGEDFAFFADYLQRAESIAFMKESVYDYRRQADSMTFHQVADSICHPVKNIRVKLCLYDHLKSLYQTRGEYDAYRLTLWLYLLRVGLS